MLLTLSKLIPSRIAVSETLLSGRIIFSEVSSILTRIDPAITAPAGSGSKSPIAEFLNAYSAHDVTLPELMIFVAIHPEKASSSILVTYFRSMVSPSFLPKTFVKIWPLSFLRSKFPLFMYFPYQLLHSTSFTFGNNVLGISISYTL